MKVTVDASVAVKWFVAEDYRKEARHLLAPRIERYAPDFLPVECANVVWKKARRGEIGPAPPFLDGIAKLPEVIGILPNEILLRDATETAIRIGHPVYDSLYIACARLTGSILVTADRRLGRIVSAQVSDVKVITLQDGAAMARVEAAGVRLIIDRDKVEELIEEWERVAATEKSVVDDVHPVPETTYLRLVKMVEGLNPDERMDLLVLGWFGDGRGHTRERLFKLAMSHVDNCRYIAGLGRYWRNGLDSWGA